MSSVHLVFFVSFAFKPFNWTRCLLSIVYWHTFRLNLTQISINFYQSEYTRLHYTFKHFYCYCQVILASTHVVYCRLGNLWKSSFPNNFNYVDLSATDLPVSRWGMKWHVICTCCGCIGRGFKRSLHIEGLCISLHFNSNGILLSNIVRQDSAVK